MTFVTRLLGYTEADLEIAAILEPAPADDSDCDDGAAQYEDWIDRLEERATSVQVMTRSHAAGEGGDPLLLSLERLRRQRNEIEQQMILLAAYMRESIKPRPYTLQRIADAAGLSVSGVRTFYSDEDIQILEERIRTAKQVVADDHCRRRTIPGKPSIRIPAGQDPNVAVAQDGNIVPIAHHRPGDER